MVALDARASSVWWGNTDPSVPVPTLRAACSPTAGASTGSTPHLLAFTNQIRFIKAKITQNTHFFFKKKSGKCVVHWGASWRWLLLFRCERGLQHWRQQDWYCSNISKNKRKKEFFCWDWIWTQNKKHKTQKLRTTMPFWGDGMKSFPISAKTSCGSLERAMLESMCHSSLTRFSMVLTNF